MRATIKFEADVTRVNEIMRSLILEESNALQDAFISLEKATTDRIVEGISDALNHIYGVTRQLEQYRDMLVSFERAKFETLIPQPAPDQNTTLENLKAETNETLNLVRNAEELQKVTQQAESFGNFIDKLNHFSEEKSAETASEEG
tara:strand:+ start:55 stop:492 length:438 start_codon:yes stop_codon:yes gene_type:complete